MKNILLLVVLSSNFYIMKAQEHSQSTRFSETDTSTITIENNEITTKLTNSLSAKYEGNISSLNDFKEVFSIIEQKLGKPSRNKKGSITWENNNEAKDHYVIFLKESAILIDYSGTKEKSNNRKKIIELIDKIEQITKLK